MANIETKQTLCVNCVHNDLKETGLILLKYPHSLKKNTHTHTHKTGVLVSPSATEKVNQIIPQFAYQHKGPYRVNRRFYKTLYCVCSMSIFTYRLAGLVVKASASRAEDPGF